MNKIEFKKYIINKKGNFREGQYKFYSRTMDFMKGAEKFLINPAGMGLGKTIATTIIINNFLSSYDLTFIANPTSQLKYIWVENTHDVGLLDKIAIWPSKRDVCIFKQLFKDKKFPLSNCNDDCPYQKRCKEDKKYTTECREDYERYMNMGKNATPLKYYEKLMKENKIDLIDYKKNNKELPFNCLRPSTLMGLRDLYIKDTRKIIIGDYNGFLIPKMFKNVTDIDPSLINSLLIIDEGHLINKRARGYYSKSIYLERDLKKLEYEFDKYKQNIKPNHQQYIIILIENIKKLVQIFKKKYIEKKVYKYNYSEFKKDFDCDDIIFNNILIALNELDKIISSNEDDGEQKSSTKRVSEYLDSLKNNSNKEEYFSSIQKKKNYNKDDIKLNCVCIDPSNHLRELYSNWDKIIINTGTLSKNKKIVLYEIGIDEKDCNYEKEIESYDLSKDTFILPEGNFNSKYREDTYKNNLSNLIGVINKISGKTIIFIQSKYDSFKLEKLLSKNIKVINFCVKENDEGEISPEEFLQLKSEFINNKNKCIGIININGRVEGHNFTDDNSIPQVKNVIIYGFPLPAIGELEKARESLYIKKFSNEESTLSHVFLSEPIQKIQQACYRCKRDNKSKPIIILWGERFSQNKEIALYPMKNLWRIIETKHNIFNSLPSDFKKNVGNYNELIKFIEKKENGRINNS